MSADSGRSDEDQEPELRAGGRAPTKKSMADFLAAFEERLKNHPDEPATGATRLVEERAGGLRRSPSADPPVDPAGPEPGTEEKPAPKPASAHDEAGAVIPLDYHPPAR